MGLQKLFERKPLWAFEQENSTTELKREYGFYSLLAFGIGGTVGSGIFISSGQIAATQAGPATWMSWLIAGLCSSITALAYCELAAILKSPGSTYSFSYYGLGEFFAIVSAWLVTLEYGVSGAAVARSWGDKVAYWFNINGWVDCADGDACWINNIGDSNVNLAAMLISIVMVIVLGFGIKIEKNLINFLVVLKVGLVLFVIIFGATLVTTSNLTPLFPTPGTSHNGTANSDFQGGASGVLMGATSAFFGYIGFDEVSCMSGEAKRPTKDIPRAILATIGSITLLYVCASIVLTGMVPYDQVEQSEGFGNAFAQLGHRWAMQVTVAGEVLIVLPTVVLVSYAPQARVMMACAVDGQLPKIFQKVNSKGTIVYSVWIAGILMTLIATFIPFTVLNDVISGGILLSFILTNSSLTLSRSQQAGKGPLCLMVVSMAVVCFMVNQFDAGSTLWSAIVAIVFGVLSLGCLVFMCCKYSYTSDIESFKVPGVPIIPAIATFVNWFLLTQITWFPLLLVLALVVLAMICYGLYGYQNSVHYAALTDTQQRKPQVNEGTATTSPTEVEVKY